jgi:hypothetical protein
MSNDIGSVKGITGNSMALNGQKGDGAQKPMPSGSNNPGNTKPPMAPMAGVPMPK